MEGAASACVINIASRTKRGSNRVVRRRDGESTILPEFQPRLSKITRRTQIVGSGRASHPIATIYDGGTHTSKRGIALRSRRRIEW
jgi:hypothetical protein